MRSEATLETSNTRQTRVQPSDANSGRSTRAVRMPLSRGGVGWERNLTLALHASLSPLFGQPQAHSIARSCLATARGAIDEPLPSHAFTEEWYSFWLTVLCCFITFTVVGHLRGGDQSSRSGTGDHAQNVELLALFANPALPQEAAGFGLRPLAFGQDLRLLMNALPSGEVEVEPAATLLNAQQALLRSNPRVVLFSGHTILGALAFETPEGRLDMHATPDVSARNARSPRHIPLFLRTCSRTDL